MIELIVVRHGETIENRLNICQGQTEGRLSYHGKQQNLLLANRLKSKEIDIAYCSPLLRAVDTCSQILEYHKNVELNRDKRLLEWNMGVLQGNVFPDKFDVLNTNYSIEPIEDVKARVKFLINEIVDRYDDKTVLIVSHGLTIRVIFSILLDIEFEKTEVVNNSSYQTIVI